MIAGEDPTCQALQSFGTGPTTQLRDLLREPIREFPEGKMVAEPGLEPISPLRQPSVSLKSGNHPTVVLHYPSTGGRSVYRMQTQNGVVVGVRNLVKEYPGIKAVDEISFDVHQGEIFGMVGPNGAGKTTTIECLEGLRRPDGGTIQVLGLDPLRDRYRLRERIGVQFQSAALPDRIKVWEALDLFAAFYRRSVDWQALLEQLGLAEKKAPISPSFPAGRNSESLSRWR